LKSVKIPLLAAISGGKFGVSVIYIKNDFMKMILRSFIYLAASLVISVYDAMRAIHPVADQQDKKRSNDNTRDKKKIVQIYSLQKPNK